MHDPNTVAFELKYPWVHTRETRPDGSVYTYRETFITIWHVDPERRGDDDSCGWHTPNDDASRAQVDQARKIGGEEWTFWNMGGFSFKRFGFVDADGSPNTLAIIHNACRVILWRVFKREWFNLRELNLLLSMVTSPDSGLRHYAREALNDRETMQHLYGLIAKNIQRVNRPWWKAPRWHVWHWRIQIPFLQDLKRFLFSRCARCGKRFTWGYAPISNQWGGGGPRWFRGERDVYHHECIGHGVASVKEA